LCEEVWDTWLLAENNVFLVTWIFFVPNHGIFLYLNGTKAEQALKSVKGWGSKKKKKKNQ
jgi:hypothetical protein